MRSKYRQWIIYLSLVSIAVTLWLVYSEIRSPGHCPPYPGIGVPACFMVLLFFGLVLLSQYVSKPGTNKLLFHLGAIPGLFTAVWFSVHQVQGAMQCPQLLGIPLCFVALGVFLLLIVLHQVRCIDENTCPAGGEQ